MDIGDRVHYYGIPGTVIDFEDYRREHATVQWRTGSIETLLTADLTKVTPEQEAILEGK